MDQNNMKGGKTNLGPMLEEWKWFQILTINQ